MPFTSLNTSVIAVCGGGHSTLLRVNTVRLVYMEGMGRDNSLRSLLSPSDLMVLG